MLLRFLGTRGEIEIRTRRHGRHSSLLVERGDGRITRFACDGLRSEWGARREGT